MEGNGKWGGGTVAYRTVRTSTSQDRLEVSPSRPGTSTLTGLGDIERYGCSVEVSEGINYEGSIVQIQEQRYGLNSEQAYASDF